MGMDVEEGYFLADIQAAVTWNEQVIHAHLVFTEFARTEITAMMSQEVTRLPRISVEFG